MGKQDDASEAWALLLELAFGNRERFMAAVAELKLAPMQAHALRLLEQPRSMSDLADQLHCDASNVTGIIDRLETRGLAERVADPDDRRVKLLRLTAEGERARARFLELLHDPPETVRDLPADDLKALKAILRRALEPT